MSAFLKNQFHSFSLILMTDLSFPPRARQKLLPAVGLSLTIKRRYVERDSGGFCGFTAETENIAELADLQLQPAGGEKTDIFTY